MLKGLDGAAALAQDLGDLLDGQVTDDAQGEDLTLVGNQIGEHVGDVLRLDGVQRVGLGVSTRNRFGDRLGELERSRVGERFGGARRSPAGARS